jgi:outer membrane murein-binding lipoprotein Lpp
MSITRVPTLLEQSIKTNAAGLADEVRTQLGCASSADVNDALVPLQASVASISGDVYTLETQVAAISGDLSALESEVVAISGALTIDIENLDISLTEAIFDHIEVDGTTPSVSASVNAWGKITAISGGPFWIALYK